MIDVGVIDVGLAPATGGQANVVCVVAIGSGSRAAQYW